MRHSTGVALPYFLLTPPNANGQITVVADDPGRSAVLKNHQPTELATRLLASGQTVLSTDLALTGKLASARRPDQRGRYASYNYAGYYFGYNPSILGERVTDLLAEIAAAHSRSGKAVNVVGLHKGGVEALLAVALAGDSVNRAAIDLNGFDFGQVRDSSDEMMLPGALKYGGVNGFAALCAAGRTGLWNVPKSAVDLPTQMARQGQAAPSEMIQWMLSSGR